MNQSWLLILAPTYPEYMIYEINELLTQTNIEFEIEPYDSEQPYLIVKASLISIDYILSRSVFLKSICLLDFSLPEESSSITAKIVPLSHNYQIDKNKKDEIKSKYKYLLNNYVYKQIKPDKVFIVYLANSKEYVGLLYKESQRKNMLKLAVMKRPFIGITAMDWELTLFMVNMCEAKQTSIVFDPFCGSGGLLLGAALFDARVIGGDNQIKNLIGTNVLKNNVRTHLIGSNIYSNFEHFGLLKSCLGIFIQDSLKAEFLGHFSVIMTDTPYGDRISLNGLRSMDFIEHLYKLSSKSLAPHGRIGFWYVEECEKYVQKLFQKYKLIVTVKQKLAKVTRVLVVYEKP